ncbi:MAG: hypothetical protein EG824_01195 [Deltaproteobacteria bacterium]|nr:hypothetical protein [Deltaproteobacteria bacterium]
MGCISISTWQQEADKMLRTVRIPNWRRPIFAEDTSEPQLAATSYFRRVTVSPSLILSAGTHRRAIIAHELAHLRGFHFLLSGGSSAAAFFVCLHVLSREPSLIVICALFGTVFAIKYDVGLILELLADSAAAKIVGREQVKDLLEWINSTDTDFSKTLYVRIRLFWFNQTKC